MGKMQTDTQTKKRLTPDFNYLADMIKEALKENMTLNLGDEKDRDKMASEVLGKLVTFILSRE